MLAPSNSDPNQRKSFDERLIDPYRPVEDVQNRDMLLTPDYKANRQSRRMERISRVLQDPEVQQQIARIRTHRPYFLWFMTFAQVVAMIVLIGTYLTCQLRHFWQASTSNCLAASSRQVHSTS